MAHVDYRYTSLHDRRGVPIEKQLTRMSLDSPELPIFLHKPFSRLSLNLATTTKHKANNYENQPMMSPKATLNPRSDFHIKELKKKLEE